MPDRQNSYPQLTPADLKDPTLFRLHTVTDFIFSQLDKIQSAVSAKFNFAVSTAGQVLTSNGAGADPTFQTLPSGTGEANSELAAQASMDLVCTTGYQDVAGLTVTLNKNGVWFITSSLDLSFDSTAAQMSGQLVVNSIAQTGIILAIIGTSAFEGLFTRSWLYTNSGSNVAKVQAKSAVASGTRSVIAANSYLSAIFLHS